MFEADNLVAIIDIVQPIWVGGCGGLAALFVHRRRPPLYAFLAAFFVSGFSGFIMGKLCSAGHVNTDFALVAVGMSGYFGPVVLNSLGKKVFSHLGIYTDSELELKDKRALHRASDRGKDDDEDDDGNHKIDMPDLH